MADDHTYTVMLAAALAQTNTPELADDEAVVPLETATLQIQANRLRHEHKETPHG